MVALKKTLLIFVLISLALCFAGCDDIPDEPVSVYDEPRATAVINDEKTIKKRISKFSEIGRKETDMHIFTIKSKAKLRNMM